MKQWISILTAVCMMSLCACGRTSDTEESRQELALRTEVTETTQKNVIRQTNAPTESTDTQMQMMTSTITAAASSQEAIATAVPEVPAQTGQTMQHKEPTLQQIPVTEAVTEPPTLPSVDVENTLPAEGVHGVDGRTQEEWMMLGQELYMEAMELAFRYLCTGSEFPFDRANLEIIDRTYFLTTCTSFEEATAAYYELFSREYHGDDFEGLLLEQNGRLYAARAARGMDMTYLSSEIATLVSASETEIVFEAETLYEDGETTATFTLVPEDGFWKVGEFTLPY